MSLSFDSFCGWTGMGEERCKVVMPVGDEGGKAPLWDCSSVEEEDGGLVPI